MEKVYFYDYYGYAIYDFVAQLDADHIPAPGYLRQMLLVFHNPKVGLSPPPAYAI